MNLEISFQPVDYSSDEHCALFCRWENDKSTRHLFSYFPDKASAEIPFTSDDFKRRASRLSLDRENGEFLICLKGIPVGFMNFELDPPHKKNDQPQTAWMAIVIGEESARGKGVGYRAMKELEVIVRESNAHWAEVGVFEFNTRAHELYKKLGYREITRVQDFVYWQGKMWNDIRLVKSLV